MNVPRRVGYIVAGLVIAGLLFQLFFRYQYVHLTGTTVMRIDRLSGSSCNLPCEAPQPPPVQTEWGKALANSGGWTTVATPWPSFDSKDQEAIQAVKASVTVPYENDGHDYKWRVSERGKNDGTHYEITTGPPQFIDAPGPTKTGFIPDTPAPSVWAGENPADWPVRLICYCYNDTPGQTEPAGFFWEYHLDTRQTYSVDDNAALSVKYGMTPRK